MGGSYNDINFEGVWVYGILFERVKKNGVITLKLLRKAIECVLEKGDKS